MNQVYESLKKYYDEHGEIMPPTKFASKHHGNVSEEDAQQGVIEFSNYLDRLREDTQQCG